MNSPEIASFAHPAVILVATDLSDIDRLMEFSLRQAKETGARLLLFHVVSTDSVFPAEAMGFPCYDLSVAVERARNALLPWCARARSQAIRCDILVREGHPAVQILEAVRQFKVGRILLCTRGRGRFSKLLLGSVAEQVLRSAQIPVITVGPEAHPEVETDGLEKVVLLATTLRETSRTSAALACHLAASSASSLLLLHVLPPAGPRQSLRDRDAEDINAMRELHVLASTQCAELNHSPHGIQVLVEHGNPCEQIPAVARARRARLIVLGAMHQFSLHSLTHDRTIYKVLAHAPCPVLTLSGPSFVEVRNHMDQELIAC